MAKMEVAELKKRDEVAAENNREMDRMLDEAHSQLRDLALKGKVSARKLDHDPNIILTLKNLLIITLTPTVTITSSVVTVTLPITLTP